MNEATHKIGNEYSLRQNLAEYLAIAHIVTCFILTV